MQELEIYLAWLYQNRYLYSKPQLEDFFNKLSMIRRGVSLDFIQEEKVFKLCQEFKKLEKLGIRHTYPGDGVYPPNLLKIAEPPFLLSYLGEPCWLDHSFLSVVGSREVSSLSISWMEENVTPLIKENQFCLVSGGARGVDQKAHEICIKNQKPTIAFLPSGFQYIYPQQIQDWIPYIVKTGGALMTEYSFEQKMKKLFFQARNRLIAGMGVCTLVVQSARRSGSQITARQCLEQGKAVLAVPGHPLDPHNLGNLDLIFDGATLVRDKADLQCIWESEANSISSLFRTQGHYI